MNKIVFYKQLFLIFSLASLSLQATAQKLKVHAPTNVSIGQKFQIKYAVDAAPESFNPPSFSEFKVIAGPATAQTFIEINGKQSEGALFTYYVEALKEGIFNVGIASVTVNGQEIKAEKFLVEVSKAGEGGSKANTPAVSGELFLKTEVSRSSLYKGESFVATIKLYARNVPVVGLADITLPSMSGFSIAQLPLAANERNFKTENLNGKLYDVAVLNRFLLSPLQTGTIVIEPSQALLRIAVKDNNNSQQSLLESFIGMPQETTERKANGATVTINVKELPKGAPDSFRGAVGDFKMTSTINKTHATANQALTFSLTISGSGDLKLVRDPEVDFPKDFDKYDSKATDNFSTGAAGSSGSKTFEYTVIPRSAGEFEIPPVEFSYFDPSKGAYIKLMSETVKLTIEKDPNGVVQPVTTNTPIVKGQKIEHLTNDILYIKTDKPLFKPAGYVYFGSLAFWAWFTIIILAFIILFVLIKKTMGNKSNVTLMRNRKANKVAQKRLKTAAKLMNEGNETGFYEEVSKAVWGYLGDKLSITAANLSRDNVADKLKQKGFAEEDINHLLKVIDDCEYARYAPGGGGTKNMYNDAVEAISKLESYVPAK